MARKKFLKYPLDNNMQYPGRIRFTPLITKASNLGGVNVLQALSKFTTSAATGLKNITTAVEERTFTSVQEDKIANTNISEINKLNPEQASAVRNRAAALALENSDVPKEVTVPGDTTVQMYLPQNIIIPDSLTYENANLNAGGAVALSGIQQGSGIASSLGTSFGQGLGTVQEALSGSGIRDEVAQLTAARITSSNFLLSDDLKSAVNIGLQARMNPNTKANFRSVNLREFSFTFKFIGTSKRETREVRDIIKFFRVEAYPDHITPRNLVPDERGGTRPNPLADIPIGFKYPNKFQIKMESRLPNGQFRDYATKIKPCYLRNITTTYNPTGMSIHEDGEPFEIDMSLTFQEFATLSKKDIEEGF